MTLHIGDLAPQRPRRELRRALTGAGPADLTLLNLNLMLVQGADGTFDQQSYVPLGVLYLAAELARAGYCVDFADYQQFAGARRFDAARLVAALHDSADVLGISVMSNLLPFAIHCARLLKRDRPERRLVLGGVGPSPVAREIVEAFPFVDHVIQGEGEINLRRILEGDTDPTPPVRLVEDLDVLPLPAYHLLDWSLYDAAPSVITSRGCPWRCRFCTEPFNFGGRVRFRAVESVFEEIERVHALSGRSLFLFQDDNLPLEPARTRLLLEGFRGLSFPMQWKCFARVDQVDDALMAEMADSGCLQIRFGIEAGSNTMLERIHKGFTIERAIDVATRAVRHFPSVHASFIWGYPGESLDELEQTLDAVTRLEDAGVSVLLFEFAPLPGSPIYRETSTSDLVFSPEAYSSYVVTGHEAVEPHTMRPSTDHQAVYSLISEHPHIFSGFYQYEGFDKLLKRKRVGRFEAPGRRTLERNPHDI